MRFFVSNHQSYQYSQAYSPFIRAINPSRIREFHLGKQADGVISREHQYLLQGITAVCVPQHNLVFQRYVIDDNADTFPTPRLFGIINTWPGDTQTAVFLGQLLSYLDLEPTQKQTLLRTFAPLFSEIEAAELCDLFGKDWRATLAAAALGKTLTPAGAREYVGRVNQFFHGTLASQDLAVGLQNAPTVSAAPLNTPPDHSAK